jgi:hypothetical protein
MKSPFSLYYSKCRKIDLGKWEQQYFVEKGSSSEIDESSSIESQYNPYDISQLQNYNPIYSVFFELNENTYNKISLNHPRHIVDLYSVLNPSTQEIIPTPAFVKFSPLLDPIHTLIGKYETGQGKQGLNQDLKQGQGLEEIFRNIIVKKIEGNKYISKIIHPFNASYVDCFFNYLSSQLKNTHAFENGVDFYGSFVGVQKYFKMNITDDYEYLQDSNIFTDNENKTYILKMETTNGEKDLPDQSKPQLQNMNSHKNKPKICISDETDGQNMDILCDDIISIGSLNSLHHSLSKDDVSLVYEKDSSKNSSVVSSSTSSSDNSILNNSSSEDEDDETDDETDEDDDDNWSDMTKGGDMEEDDENPNEDPNIYAYIKDFPVQMICIEQCDGTLDELLENRIITDENVMSALMQVIMTLITYQKAFHFTHNDLHTNNIVFKETDKKWIEYTYNNKKYKVPTYGKIFKIIDFGRSIYRFQDKFICSDSFAHGGDAHTQYNIEPYFNNKKPRLDPNMSFDLCRLGCSIYDFVFDEDDDVIDQHPGLWTELQETIMRWCTDDYGKNILYKKNGEERYPNFKLYKMIARIVHKHIPETQLLFPGFSQYLQEDSQQTKIVSDMDDIIKINIDEIPKYYL